MADLFLAAAGTIPKRAITFLGNPYFNLTAVPTGRESVSYFSVVWYVLSVPGFVLEKTGLYGNQGVILKYAQIGVWILNQMQYPV